MQNLTGSIQQEVNGLTPFEQAERNIVMFASNVRMNYELKELLDRLEYLNNLKHLTLGMPMSGSFAAAASGYSLTIDNEISGIELAIEIFCNAGIDQSSET